MTTPARLPVGAASGVGSLPGDDPLEAARTVMGELPDLPHLVELPDRGAWADLAGRGAALLADLHVDLQPTGWRAVPRPSQAGRRAKDLLERDLDALEEAVAGDPPEVLKVQATGPWTLATLVELHRGDKVLADHGAVADLAASLAEGIAQHLADLGRRLPGTRFVLQLDEPSLPAVIDARVKTSSGFATLRKPDRLVTRERLQQVLAVGGTTVLHCCAARPPWALLALADVMSIDATLLDPRDDDVVGELVEAGTGLLLGCVTREVPDVKTALAPVLALRYRIGSLPADVVLTPTCGLAGMEPARARAVLSRTREAASALQEELG